MAEKKGVGHAYNIDFLNVVFAASSIFLFLSIIWMVWDDYDREWKNVQRHFVQLDYQVTQQQLQQAEKNVNKTKLTQLQTEQKNAEANVAKNQAKVDELQKKKSDAANKVLTATLDYNYAKALYDQDRYDFESARQADPNASSTKSKQQKADEEAKRLADLNHALEQAKAEAAAVDVELGKYTGELAAVQKQIEEMNADQGRLQKRLDTIAPSALKDYFRDAPLLDFMAPTIKVQQLVLPNVVDDVNFIRVPKMDRCQTCHLAIDRKGYEKYPQPYTTHPNLDLYLGGSSKHPIDKVGCTVCHEGEGQSVDFRTASHTPSTPKQKEEWEKTYEWEEPHEWDYPMLPVKMTTASCAKCHKQQEYIPQADELNIAYATFERAGCYACHKTRGFEVADAANPMGLRKPGPILTKISSKLSKDWVKNWIRNPRAVKPTTWMPRFFYNSNNSSPEDAKRNEVEINAIVEYLFANSEPWDAPVKTPPRGDAKSGEEIVKAVGCQGCHVVGEGKRDEVGPRRTFGQPLENIGNKTSYEWIYNWVRDPKHYNPATYMPNLRLTDQQAADVATYLSGLKGPAGDAAKATADQAAVDAVLLDYLKSVMPLDDAKAKLASMSADQKEQDLGQRAISRYGCFSCHDIKGFEKAQSIGTDLSEEGTKLVTRLDFAFITSIPHTSKLEWFKTKLHDPRIFDQGRVLDPLDKLRMPNFDFSDVEVERLVTAIMSFQRDIQPPAAMPARSARYDYQTAGRTLVHRRNCVGCHTIEGDGGDFVKLVADPSLGPPLLTPEGARVQPDWLYAFLRGPIQIRPWLNVRMPTFGLDDVALNGVIRYFGAVSDTIGPFQTHVMNVSAQGDAGGKALFETLQCQKCHVLGAIPKDQPTSNLAPDLRMAPERLQPDWILQWLKNPGAILPGTRMPQFWPDYPKSPYPNMNGDADAQIRAIRDHLLTFKGGPSPKNPGSETKAANN
jgi:mono/diheme cytochrome c family protein